MTDSPWSTPFSVDAGAHSVVGNVREHNEDSARVDGELGLYAVADGLGGHRAGEHASSLAVDVLDRALRETRDQGDEPSFEAMVAAFDRANQSILDDASERPERRGMGTTLTAALLVRGGLLLGHVGDSRAWRIRDGEISQLTQDHTVVAEQVREGSLTAEDAEQHPMRHILSRCLGIREQLEVDVIEADVAADDIYVLASDGIWPGLGPDEIAEIAQAEEDAEAACRRLVDRACERDGQDNVTAVVVICREG